MIYQDLFSRIHWLPVIVMTLFSFVLGMLWHQPFLFGKTWAKENNTANVQKKVNLPLTFGGTALMHFVAIASLSAVVSRTGLISGLLIGLFISLVWVLPAMSGTYLFANRSLKLLAIDAGMYIVLFSICGLILSIW
jgi:NADH:ubiquinone oxidoreductase subunit 5 (subunit L)/multisubunit Na+/H+ antiporter MnhA subunit